MAKGKPNKKSVKRMPIKDNFGLGGGRVKGYNRAETEPKGVQDRDIEKITGKEGGFLRRGPYSGR